MKLRVWNIINPPAPASRYPVGSVQAGILKINQLARIQLRDKRINCNVFGLEIYAPGIMDDEDWVEWENEMGETVDDLMRDGYTTDQLKTDPGLLEACGVQD